MTLTISQWTHDEGMIDASSQARLSTQSACKSSGDPLPKNKQGTHALVASALVLVIISVQVFPSYLLARCLQNPNPETFGQCQVWHAEQCSDASFLLLQQYYRGKGKWEYMPVVGFAKAFDQTEMAKTTRGSLAQPYQAPNPKCEEALITYKYALNGESLTVHILGLGLSRCMGHITCRCSESFT